MKRLFPLYLLWLLGCSDKALPPINTGSLSKCIDANRLGDPEGEFSSHFAQKLPGKLQTPAGLKWANPDSIMAFMGTKDFKLTFTAAGQLYLAEFKQGLPTVTLLTRGDEGPDLAAAEILSPLFSPDGKFIVYATEGGRQGFVRQAIGGDKPAWRIPLSTEGYLTADPHFVSEGNADWIWFANTEGNIDWLAECESFSGVTYRIRLMGDTAVDSLQPTGMPGAFRGGVSPGGWAGTTYSTTGLKSLVRGDKELWKSDSKQPTQLLAGGQQKCNASMNPFPANNLHPDYMLLLAFGGEYQSVTGTVKEALHENLWVYNSKNKIVAQVKRPDSLNYRLWDKPEWSTHARYATAVANPMSELDNCDLFIIDLGDLQLHSENNLAQAQATFRLASGGLTRGSYTHLWVSP